MNFWQLFFSNVIGNNNQSHLNEIFSRWKTANASFKINVTLPVCYLFARQTKFSTNTGRLKIIYRNIKILSTRMKKIPEAQQPEAIARRVLYPRALFIIIPGAPGCTSLETRLLNRWLTTRQVERGVTLIFNRSFETGVQPDRRLLDACAFADFLRPILLTSRVRERHETPK